MRSIAFVSVVGALALIAGLSEPATAAKSKMGCEQGSEVWDAAQGACVPGSPKWKKAAPAPAVAEKSPPAAKKVSAKKTRTKKTPPAK